METIKYIAALAITCAIRGSPQGKNIPRIRFGDSSTTTLVYKTLLCLQTTKITVSKVLSFFIQLSLHTIYHTEQGNVLKLHGKSLFKNTFFLLQQELS